MSTLDLAALRALPKVELHVHLEGAISPGLALRLAQRNGRRLPGDLRGEAGLREAYRFTNFGDFIRMYVAISSCFAGAVDFREATLGVADDMIAEGICHAELTFTPMTHIARGVDADAMLGGLLEGQVEAQRRGLSLAWVFDIVRSLPEQGPKTVALLERARAMGLHTVGVGVGGPEGPQFAAQPLVPSITRAKAMGFSSLPHAGEQDGAQSIWSALQDFGADRIGHGVRCLEDPSLVETLRARQTPLEVCPSSNVCLDVVESIGAHPIERMLEAGLAVSLNSDDPALFGTSLAREYLRCVEAFAWDANRVVSIARAGVEHSHLQREDAAKILNAQARWCHSYATALPGRLPGPELT